MPDVIRKLVIAESFEGEEVPQEIYDIATNLPYRDFITVGLLLDKLLIQNKTKFNENIFDCIDTEEKAYWLGFIFADGSIRSNGSFIFELSLKGSDINHLHKFNTFMGHIKDNVKIGKVYVQIVSNL